VARKTTRGAWFASNASCQRGAHKHQRSPGFRPGKPSSGMGVERSLPRDLKNRERRLSSRRRPCDCQHLLAQYCSSRPDESRSWAASSRFRAARRARYVRSTGDQLHCPCCLAALSSPAPQAPQGATKSWHPAPERARAESSVSAYLRVGIGTPNIRVDRFLRLAVRFRLVLFALRFLAM
jgi:hypothetical protein